MKIFLWKKRRFRLRWDSSPGLSIASKKFFLWPYIKKLFSGCGNSETCNRVILHYMGNWGFIQLQFCKIKIKFQKIRLLFSNCKKQFLNFQLQNVEYSDTCICTEHMGSLIYGQWKNVFELKKVLLIQKIFLWSREIDLFTLKNFLVNFWNNFFNFQLQSVDYSDTCIWKFWNF